jgi:hypothetical protein
MRVIIAGSRDIEDYPLLCDTIRLAQLQGIHITSVVCGTARGVDQMGERWAKEHNIPVDYHPAQWGLWGKAAGVKRNEVMAANADALILLWDGSSRGSSNMLMNARKRGLKICARIEAPAQGVNE